MAKFRFDHYIDIHWNGYDIVGDGGTIFSIPDQLYEEFESDLRPVEPSLEWTVVNEFLELQNSVSVTTLTGTAPIVVTDTSAGRDISLNANYQTAGTYVTSVTGTAPITASGTTAITVGIDQTAITANSATNAEVLRTYVKNTSGSAMTKGQAVYVNGATGTNVTIQLATATSEVGSSKTLGLLAQDLANNAFGYVIESGFLGTIDTSAATAGSSVWLGDTPGSRVYNAPPAEPSHSVFLGIVARSNLNNGEILVQVQNGYELNELHDVSAASPSNGDIIQYKTSSGLWTKQSLVNAGISTSGHLHTEYVDTTGDTVTGALTISNTGSLAVFGATSTANTQVSTRVDGDASTRWGVRADGFQAWGDGTSSRDTNLYRSAANTLATDDNLEIGQKLTVDGLTTINGSAIVTSVVSATGAGAIRIYTDAATSPAPLTVTVAGDTVNRYAVTASGGLEFGSGSATRDSGIYRSGAATLATIGNFTVGTDLTVGGDITHASQLDLSAGGAVGASVTSSGLYLPPGKTVMFEGTTNNTSEIQLTAEDATADRTITLPDASGTVALTNSTFSVQSAVNGTSTTITTSYNRVAGLIFTFTPTFNEQVRVTLDLCVNQSAAPSGTVNLVGRLALNTAGFGNFSYTAVTSGHGSPNYWMQSVTSGFQAVAGTTYTVEGLTVRTGSGTGTFVAAGGGLTSMFMTRVRE